MTMPKWHQTMKPMLEALAKSDGLALRDLMEFLVEVFQMSPEEQEERLASGELRLYNRLTWGAFDLKRAGYVDTVRRGLYKITDEGRAFLSSHPGPITDADLYDSSESFREWKDGYLKAGKTREHSIAENSELLESPQESIEEATRELRSALVDDLLLTIMDQSPYFFEHLVGRLLKAMGYGEGIEEQVIVTPKSADEGIDGIVQEDRLGFDSVYYQAKRWDVNHKVGRPDIQAFVGALSGKGAAKGLFITTSEFTCEARDYSDSLKNHRLVLVDGRTLAGLMIDYNVGVSTTATYEIKAIDSDFFSEG